MGTRTAGDFGKFSGLSGNVSEVKALGNALDVNASAKSVVDAALGVVGVAVPVVGAIVLSSKVAYSIYKGVKAYKETGSVGEGMKTAGFGIAKTAISDVLMPKAVSSVVGAIAPAMIGPILPKNKAEASEDLKIIKAAGTAAGEML